MGMARSVMKAILASLPVVAGCLGMPSTGSAVELVVGGALVGENADPQASLAAWDVRSPEGSSSPPAFSMGFTPRAGAGFHLGSDRDEDAGLSFRLDLSGVDTSAMRLSPLSSGGAVNASPRGGLALGGAMSWSDWRVGGSVSRANLFDTDADLLGGSLGYGNVTARLAYGAGEAPKTGAERDMWLFSTDLEMRSWLTLQGDFAISTPESSAAEPATAGRLGVKLRF